MEPNCTLPLNSERTMPLVPEYSFLSSATMLSSFLVVSSGIFSAMYFFSMGVPAAKMSASTAFLIFSILVLLEIQRSVLRALHREQPDVAEYLILFGVQSAVLHQFQHGEEGGDYVAVVEVRLEE